MSNLPTTEQTISLDPWLEDQLEEMLEPLDGDQLEAARGAVRDVHDSGVRGSAHEILAEYSEAVGEAVEQVD